MGINISFGGAQIKRPGAYSRVDSNSMVVTAQGGFKVLAAIGVPAVGNTLVAGTVAYFNDPVIARAAVGECELMDIMSIAWNHGADLIAVSPVAAPATDADWQAAIDRFASEAIDGIIIASTSPAIAAKVDAHCSLMSSTVNRRERRAFYGHATGMTVVAIKALQTALNSEYAVMASPGVYVFDTAGNKVLKASNYLAAAYAGVWAGQSSQEPITYKYVKFPGLEVIYNGVEIGELLTASIAPTEYVQNKGYRIVQGITMSSSSDLTMCELSVSTTKADMAKILRNTLEDKYVGKAGVAGIEVTIYNDFISILEGFKKTGYIAAYVPESAKVIKQGTAFIVEWEGSPTLPINNFLITSHLKI